MDLILKIENFPKAPGVYLMKGKKGAILYVGKAKVLKTRVKSYFKNEAKERYQIKFLMDQVADIDFIQTSTEKEALLLEYKLIQEHKPKYNIDLKDNKTFIRIRIGAEHRFPSIYITRKVKKDGAEYFGPYTSAYSARETLEQITKFFKIRTCSDREFANRSRPCLQHQIKRCTAPCVGFVSEGEYKTQIEEAKMFLKGKKKDLTKYLKAKMAESSGALKYEEAARYRDVINHIKETLEKQKIMNPAGEIRLHEDVVLSYSIIGESLKTKLTLAKEPNSIECVDISNIQGRFPCGAIVSFVEGSKDKERYRLFNITRMETPNDYAMMYEVLERRFKHSEWQFPDLLLVDGGKGQLSIAKRVLDDLQIANVSLASIAKEKINKEEGDKIYLPGRSNPVKFKKGDIALLYLMRIRDEAHRFVISHYRKRHSKFAKF